MNLTGTIAFHPYFLRGQKTAVTPATDAISTTGTINGGSTRMSASG